MADASKIMNYLVNEFETAPAGTREEAEMAKALGETVHMHGLETVNQDFTYSALGETLVAALMALVAIIGLASVALSGVVQIIFLIICLACVAVCYLERSGTSVVSRFGMKGYSQNVIACHPAAEGTPRKSRPVVIVAHYDTPRADFMATPALRKYIPYLNVATVICMVVVPATMLLRLLPLPGIVSSILAALGIIAALVIALSAARTLLMRHVMRYTRGANDNMSGVAAVLGVLDRVRPSMGSEFAGAANAHDVPDPAARAEASQGAQPAASETSVGVKSMLERGRQKIASLSGADKNVQAQAAEDPLEKRQRARKRQERLRPAGKRRGEEVLRSLGMVPETCQIVYEQEVAEETIVAPNLPAAVAREVAKETLPKVVADAAEEAAALSQSIPMPAMPSSVDDPTSAIPMSALMTGAMPAAVDSTSALTAVNQQPVARAPQTFDVIVSTDEADAELRTAMPAQPFADEVRRDSVLNSPAWGTTSFKPVAPQARRILEDLPDPAIAAVDPYSVADVETIGDVDPDDFSAMDFETGTHETVTPAMLEDYKRRNLDGFVEIDEAKGRKARKAKKGSQGRISHRAAAMQAEMEEQSFTDWLGVEQDFDARTNGAQIGSWQNFEDAGATTVTPSQTQATVASSTTQMDSPAFTDAFPDDSDPTSANRWQGGAVRAHGDEDGDLLGDEALDLGEGVEEDDDELRHAAMSLGDLDLVSHEIWFVFTGASEEGHAGIKALMGEYGRKLRGAMFINVDCIGVGRQSLLLKEGQVGQRKADRRLVNLVGQSSQDLGRALALARSGWSETEATAIMRAGCRAVTLCGMADDALANARWVGDLPDSVDSKKVDDVVDILAEVIRRS